MVVIGIALMSGGCTTQPVHVPLNEALKEQAIVIVRQEHTIEKLDEAIDKSIEYHAHMIDKLTEAMLNQENMEKMFLNIDEFVRGQIRYNQYLQELLNEIRNNSTSDR